MSLNRFSGAFCYAELGTVIKQSGAEYVYMDKAYGDPMSYIFSWVNNFLVKPASMATITLTCAQYIMTPIFDDGCGEAPTHIKLIFAIFFLCKSHSNAYACTYVCMCVSPHTISGVTVTLSHLESIS